MDIYKTSNYKSIYLACEEAKSYKKLVSIIGNTRSGKSTVLNDYQKNSSNVYKINACRSMSIKRFYLDILSAMEFDNFDKNSTLHDLFKKVCYSLNTDNEPKLLIIDEVGKFSSSMLRYLEDLRLQTKDSTGIILSAPEYFKNNLI